MYGWSDVCELNFEGQCKYGGPLNYWSMNFTEYLAAVNGSATDPTAGSRDVLISTVNMPTFPDGGSVSTLSIFGGITLSPLLGTVPPGAPPLFMSGAKVLACGYGLRDGLGDATDKWYNKFLDVLEARAASSSYASLSYIAGNSVDTEIGRSVTADLYLIVISVAIFVLVAIMGMSRLHSVATRSSLALLGVVSSLLAMIAGYGLSLLFGCAFTTLSQTLPYVLLGLSVDCMFILTKAYDGLVAADPGLALEERLRRLMGSAGTSVVITLLASAVAFALGSISEMPAIRWFSVYATMGVICILVATLTFFAGVFVLTERRIAANHVDCCCCVVSANPPVPTAAQCLLSSDYASPEPSITFAHQPPPTAATASYQPPQPAQVPSRGPVAEAVERSGSADASTGGYDQTAGAVATVTATDNSQRPYSNGSSGGSSGRQTAGGAVPPTDERGAKGGPDDGLAPRPSIPSAFADHSAQDAAFAPSRSPTSADMHPQGQGQGQGQGDASKGLGVVEEEPNLMKKIFAKYYAPALTRWWVKALVLLAFAGWAVLSGVGAPRLEEGQPLSELAPDDSYLQGYVAVTEDTFQQQIGSPTELYFRWVDPSRPQVQAAMLAALGTALDNSYVNSTVSAFQGNWLIEFTLWVQDTHPNVTLVPGCANPFLGRVSGDLGLFVQPRPLAGCVPQADFYPLLHEFLAIARGFQDDMRWSYRLTLNGTAVPNMVSSSRFPLIHTAAADNGAYGRKCIGAVRRTEDDINDGPFAAENAYGYPDDVAFMLNGDYIFAEGDAILGSMTIEYILLAVAGVGLVLCLTLPSLRAVLFMMLAVGLVDFFLFGEMFILGINFNQVSIINMIMATGLAVDYSVYFAQRFVAVEADGTLNGRMSLALADTGSSVFVGGLTALAGTIPLAFSSSTILRTFFALIFGTIAFALLIGLMLMPVVFSLVGPPPLRQGAAQGARVSPEQEPGAAQGRGQGDKGVELV
ncbi:hypothetical protein HYH03_016448 [Edaphochlamys debaryana]|uniref:SSD domain-containing protein n=1 Tax=Edaphochlamys debaryana TaxID=47281 RepID=A0A836BQ60_9CHLO|nr:hypothetical protein HYH03_016448 [Edaphochlamys debaryana]|eukprot:KAG2484795.1 hypothetical protein HYH03_016448 [Edaphochlamys debaryana]